MLTRPKIMLAMLGAAAGVPYVATNWSTWTERDGSSTETYAASAALDPGTAQTFAGGPTPEKRRAASGRIAEVLRLDVTPQWVYQRWHRKSTKLADLERHAVRVPLVTGTDVSDLAGSLTYYFDSAGQVQRVTFHGQTGDPYPLVALMQTQYRLRVQTPQIPGEHLFQVRWNGRPTSELRVTSASVISASTPHENYQVKLELAHPSSGRFLDDPTPQQAAAAEQQRLASARETAKKKAEAIAKERTFNVRSGPLHSSMYFQPRHAIEPKKQTPKKSG
jgi:hypothetical protein